MLIAGDVNSRTADRNIDFSLSDDIDSETAEALCTLVKRNSQDDVVNQFGEQLLEFCNMFDCFIVNGLSKMKFDDGFTYFADNGSSVLDY